MGLAVTTCLGVCRHKSVSVFIVYATLMIDNMLLTSVVPVLPEFMMKDILAASAEISNSTDSLGIVYNETKEEGNYTTESYTSIISGSTMSIECAEKNKEKLAAKNLLLAFLLASKPFVQLIANIFVGPITDKIGYDMPMFFGYIVIIGSSLIFAFGNHYATLFLARSLQGIGSACAATAGMALLASQYQDDDERGRKIGVALGGLAMGVLVGPSFASLTYQLTGGKEVPFIILAGGACLVAILQLLVRICGTKESFKVKSASSICNLLKDPYVLLAASTLMLGNMSIGVLETSLPTWLISTLCAAEWMLGFAMLPPAISYLVATAIFARVGTSGHRWMICFVSFFITAIGSILLPFCISFLQIIGPGLLIGGATGMVDSSIFPILGNLADTRHSSVYGRIYAIGDASFCMAFIVGPLLAGTIVHEVGFKWVMIAVAILNILFAPLVLFLKNPPSLHEEIQGILSYSNEAGDEQVRMPNMALGRVVEKQGAYEKLQ